MERKTVLVVEDNRDELLIYTTLLSHRGYAVLTASDFESALRIAIEHRPDIAIVDVNLGSPTHDGTDLIRALRESDRTRHVPVIAHTAFGDVYRESLERVGCDKVLHKPTNPSVLLQALEELVGPPTT